MAFFLGNHFLLSVFMVKGSLTVYGKPEDHMNMASYDECCTPFVGFVN